MSAKSQRCSRCRRRLRNPHAGDGWNAVFESGIFVGVLCPDCPTPMENAEAEINLATLDYGAIDGRIVGRPKVTIFDLPHWRGDR